MAGLRRCPHGRRRGGVGVGRHWSARTGTRDRCEGRRQCRGGPEYPISLWLDRTGLGSPFHPGPVHPRLASTFTNLRHLVFRLRLTLVGSARDLDRPGRSAGDDHREEETGAGVGDVSGRSDDPSEGWWRRRGLRSSVTSRKTWASRSLCPKDPKPEPHSNIDNDGVVVLVADGETHRDGPRGAMGTV